MDALVFIGELSFDKEDGGMALVGESIEGTDPHLFVKVQSWDEDKDHPTMRSLEGKRIRITIEDDYK